jgi:hypothetical protein
MSLRHPEFRPILRQRSLRRRAIAGLALFALLTAAPVAAQDAPAQEAAPPPTGRDVDVSIWTSRTALFVGDQVTLRVEFSCSPGVEILTEDLSRERLKTDGLDVLSASTSRDTTSAERSIQRVEYVLATYRPTTNLVTVEPLNVRYYRRQPGQRAEDAVPAGELTVSAVQFPVRSTLDNGIEDSYPRDTKRPVRASAYTPFVRPVALGLILLSIVPVGLQGVALFRRWQQPTARRRARDARAASRLAIKELQDLDVSSDTACQEAYNRLDSVVRGHLANTAGVPAPALTPAEVAAGLGEGKRKGAPADVVRSILEDCQRVRYGPPDSGPAREGWHDLLRRAEQVLGD